jgi:hypothetical protein
VSLIFYDQKRTCNMIRFNYVGQSLCERDRDPHTLVHTRLNYARNLGLIKRARYGMTKAFRFPLTLTCFSIFELLDPLQLNLYKNNKVIIFR